MAENSKIEWTHHTFNPWEGCQKVGPGCDHCYAETRNARFAGGTAINWGPGAPRRRTSVANWRLPLQWDARAARLGTRFRVFCASLADVFDNAVEREWRDDLATLILDTPNLDWLLLTKRIGNAGAMLGEMFLDGPPDNLWLGATIVNQDEADRDIPKLLSVPAAKRFLSMEPLLGPVKLETYGHRVGVPSHAARGVIDWVIVGGESGPGARPMHPAWARSLRDQCQAAGVPFLFKQWGEWLPGQNEVHPYVTDPNGTPRTVAHHQDGRWGSTETKVHDGNYVLWADDGTMHRGSALNGQYFRPQAWAERVGKKAAGRLLDGRTWDEVPA